MSKLSNDIQKTRELFGIEFPSNKNLLDLLEHEIDIKKYNVYYGKIKRVKSLYVQKNLKVASCFEISAEIGDENIITAIEGDRIFNYCRKEIENSYLLCVEFEVSYGDYFKLIRITRESEMLNQ